MKEFTPTLILLLGTFAVSGLVHAQQPGSGDYNRVFVPAHGAGDTGLHNPRNRWGAYALSPVNHWSGFVVGHRSEVAASRAAVEMCTQRGGISCVSESTFVNSCMIVATGEASGTYAAYPNLKGARRRAMEQCNVHNKSCEILWEGCALIGYRGNR